MMENKRDLTLKHEALEGRSKTVERDVHGETDGPVHVAYLRGRKGWGVAGCGFGSESTGNTRNFRSDVGPA
jgi:hypothetical protein